MHEITNLINNYLFYCEFRKNLDKKTLKAYRKIKIPDMKQTPVLHLEFLILLNILN